ncbi:flagellin [Anaerosacchariphilus polymeriproducens]|uniref:Flagellin n=1 Tax=Anaerosacchariphilus polymeriproducens TaxID=1812858 RepID=A0A371AQL0_9FIRM|nr:flagellin [Anaerosacchariphilus polymeriproducens]RDU21863.1 flagellin [Anaerosacchariphilus polymeriproducens]
MGISAIGSYGIGYDNLASMSSITTAADNPSGLAIAEKLETAKNGYDVGTDNAATAKDAINVADGALASITDNLQRMRELGVKASNSAIYNAEDLTAMQKEIEQLKQSIQDAAKGTEFNKKSLLDGSMADMNIATNPDGSGMKIKFANSTLESLGIANFDVTGNFNLDDIDKALETISSSRSDLGAQSNSLDSIMNYNQNASYNMTASKSTLEDLDIGKALTEKQKDKVLEQYRYFAQKAQIENKSKSLLMQRMFG